MKNAVAAIATPPLPHTAYFFPSYFAFNIWFLDRLEIFVRVCSPLVSLSGSWLWKVLVIDAVTVAAMLGMRFALHTVSVFSKTNATVQQLMVKLQTQPCCRGAQKTVCAV